MKDLFDLVGKKAIITGGAGMLGIQHSRALLQIGCKVEIWDIDSNALKKADILLQEEFKGQSVSQRVVNITNEKEIELAVQTYLSSSEKIDILINNAALNPKFQINSTNRDSHFENYSLENWNQEIAVGLTGSMLCSKHVGTHMASFGGGVILNIASDLSLISPDQRIYEIPELEGHEQFKKPVSYSVVKSGLVGLTKFLSTYWADKGVRANSLSPGGVYEKQDQNFVENLISRIPMARMANVDEYIGAIQFLCSDASSYMNGHNMVIDGGRSIW